MSAAKQPTLEWTPDLGGYPRVANQGKLFDREDCDLNAPVYLGSGLNVDSAAHFAARESVQNSMDAFNDPLFQRQMKPGSTCHVKVRYVTLTGKAKKTVLQDLGVDPNQLHARYKTLPTEKDREGVLSEALNRLANPGRPLTLLYIEEEHASGMYHSKNEVVSPFKLYAATMSINESDKEETAGGSYGQGKTALLAASRLQINYVYTEYGWHKAHGHTNEAALIGLCSWPAHMLGADKYTGYAFVAANVGGNAPTPYRDSVARELAKTMGFERNYVRPGSATLIVEPAFSSAEFEKALLANWWPALLEGTVQISVASESNGFSKNPSYRRLDPRSGSLKEQLAGFCAAYDSMKSAPITEADIGNLGLVVDDSYDPQKPVTVAYVAKMRQIGLVVEYQKVTGAKVEDGKAVYGCFQADVEADRVLRRTENKGHTRWGTTQKKDSEGTKKAKEVAEHIRTQVNEFVRTTRQDQATDSKLSSVLSSILKNFANNPGTGARGNPDGGPKPRRDTESASKLLRDPRPDYSAADAKFSLEFTALRDTNATVTFCYVQDGKAMAPGTAIAIELRDGAGRLVEADDDSRYPLRKDQRYTAKTLAKELVNEIATFSLDAGWQVSE